MFDNFIPEIMLCSIALFTLLLGLFCWQKVLASIAISLLAMLTGFVAYYDIAPYDLQYNIDNIVPWYKILLLLFTLFACVIWNKLSRAKAFEYIPLLLLHCLGGFVMISAIDFLSLFVGLELQALVSYILVTMGGDVKSSEAGIKYFCLGAAVTCILLFGISLIYGISASFNYSAFTNNILSSIGIILVILSLMFKLAAAPMHMWLADAYQGAPVFSLNVLASSNKFSALVALINILTNININFALLETLKNIFIVCGIFSVLVGSFGALWQNNFKRFLAYSGILDVAYVLFCLATQDYTLATIYISVYIFNVLALLGTMVYLKLDIENLSIPSLAGHILDCVFPQSIFYKGLFLVCVLSLMGLPPLPGFIIKYYAFSSIITHGYTTLAMLLAAASCLAAYYYLKFIRCAVNLR